MATVSLLSGLDAVHAKLINESNQFYSFDYFECNKMCTKNR